MSRNLIGCRGLLHVDCTKLLRKWAQSGRANSSLSLPVVWPIAIAVGLIFVGCVTNPTDEGQTTDISRTTAFQHLPAGAVEAASFSYLLENDTLYLMEYVCKCEGSDLFESSKIRVCPYYLKEDSLRIRFKNIANADSLSSVSIFINLTREFGEGIHGVWEIDTMYLSLTGNYSAADSIETAMELEDMRASDYSYFSILKDRMIFVYRVFDPEFPSVLLAANRLHKKLKNGYRISIDSLEDSSFVLTGEMNNEVVVVSIDSASNIHYTSDNPDHKAAVHYSDPEICPNPEYPNWFDSTFLYSNRVYSFHFLDKYSKELMKSGISIDEPDSFNIVLYNSRSGDSVFITEDSTDLGVVQFSATNKADHCPQPHIFHSDQAISSSNVEFPSWLLAKFVKDTLPYGTRLKNAYQRSIPSSLYRIAIELIAPDSIEFYGAMDQQSVLAVIGEDYSLTFTSSDAENETVVFMPDTTKSARLRYPGWMSKFLQFNVIFCKVFAKEMGDTLSALGIEIISQNENQIVLANPASGDTVTITESVETLGVISYTSSNPLHEPQPHVHNVNEPISQFVNTKFPEWFLTKFLKK